MPQQIEPSAEVSSTATIGQGTRIWHQAQVREGARIGRNCILSKGVYVDFDVVVGDNVKIQNGCYVYHGVTIEDGVFLGPGAILTNDKTPRAINRDGSLKDDADWNVEKILVKRGAALGAGVVVLPGVAIGRFAIIGAAALVTKDVPDHGLVMGNPARLVAFVCHCGTRLRSGEVVNDKMQALCDACDEIVPVPIDQWV